MIPIAITIAIAMITGCLGFWLGSVLNYQRGYTDAWAEADEFDALENDLADIRWVVTPKGEDHSSPLTNDH